MFINDLFAGEVAIFDYIASRDEAIVDRVGELIAQGKNVFIAYGATHAVMQKAAIKSLWDEENK